MRDKLVTEPSEFETKVEELVEQLGEEIAAIASDGEEFENGIAIAAIALLDLSLGNDDIDDDLDDDLDPWNINNNDDEFDLDDDEEMGWFGTSLDEDDLDTDHGP